MQNIDKQAKSKAKAGFGERLNTAAAAKKAMVEKWRANKVDTTDPAYLEKQAALQVAAAARAERDAQRKAEKEAAKLQAIADRKAEKDAAAAQIIADQAAVEAARIEAIAAEAALEEQRKAARDARYAARKARSK
ncbi:DUF6481 family protein [Magnetospirillum fulvum]|uniref:Uncharacterized protein n=1 Tax=Magnetospirillum fulvum TaxID=1082 RepID=A0A1H6IFS0_MAGFU|nr:DUF6481 family protein [Magnetospirillum fulvum]SEH46717.1 hypothetical protein SAMN04244559_02496 [Magnetospirillum fulvum]